MVGKKLKFIFILLGIMGGTSSTAFAKVAPELAGTLSVVPGLGQVANGQVLEGLAWFMSSMVLLGSADRNLSTVGFKIWSYNLYDAYKDAGGSETTQHSALSNYLAFVNPVNLLDAYTIPTLGVQGAIATQTAGKNKAKLGPNSPLWGAFYFGFVGWGEEGLFRGFLYPAFSKGLHSHFWGATVSSALFSLSHLTNTNSYYHSTRGQLILFLWGMLWCAQASHNAYDLRHNIFSHAWFDIITEYAGDQASGNSMPPLGLKITLPLP